MPGFEINVFKDLTDKYPSWDELRSYLESDEGGLFRIVDTDDDAGTCLIRYEKGSSKMDLPHSRWFRSVVWNTNINLPVCVAPPKASNGDVPCSTLKAVSEAGIMCQEYLEGVMINCYRVAGVDQLFITSRSKLDASGRFYSNKSFRELFMEAMADSGMSIDEIPGPDVAKNQIAVFYSYLVQHKEHRIVKDIKDNGIISIQKGTVYNDGQVVFEDTVPESANIPLEQGKMSYARMVSDNENELEQWIKDKLQEKDWQFQGLVFKDQAGNRWRYRSDKYAAVKALRGNTPTMTDRFAQLYTQNLLKQYLDYYPEDTLQIAFHIMCIDTIIKFIYDEYVDLHITKSKKAEEIEKMYLPHLYNIHGIYLSQLRPNKKKVNMNEIKVYMHKQPWQRIAFLIKKKTEGMMA
jgi:hypothetical protein